MSSFTKNSSNFSMSAILSSQGKTNSVQEPYNEPNQSTLCSNDFEGPSERLSKDVIRGLTAPPQYGASPDSSNEAQTSNDKPPLKKALPDVNAIAAELLKPYVAKDPEVPPFNPLLTSEQNDSSENRTVELANSLFKVDFENKNSTGNLLRPEESSDLEINPEDSSKSKDVINISSTKESSGDDIEKELISRENSVQEEIEPEDLKKLIENESPMESNNDLDISSLLDKVIQEGENNVDESQTLGLPESSNHVENQGCKLNALLTGKFNLDAYEKQAEGSVLSENFSDRVGEESSSGEESDISSEESDSDSLSQTSSDEESESEEESDTSEKDEDNVDEEDKMDIDSDKLKEVKVKVEAEIDNDAEKSEKEAGAVKTEGDVKKEEDIKTEGDVKKDGVVKKKRGKVKKEGDEKKDETTKKRGKKRKNTDKSSKQEKKKKKAKLTVEEKKARKLMKQHNRKAIRKIIKEEEIGDETRTAQQEEMERKRRLQEAQMKAQSQSNICLKALLESSEEEEEDGEVKPQEKTRKSKYSAFKPSGDVIELSSDEDDIVMPDKNKGLDDDVDDPNDCGLHVNDAANMPNEDGMVLVNIGHPSDENDVFLPPQLSRAVKPHQVGGIRFLYDNIVESLNRFKTSAGFGCILAHSMGLGKTIQVISFIDIFIRTAKGKSVLCIVPINTLQNWVNEFNMWLPDASSIEGIPVEMVQPRTFPIYIVNEAHKTMDARKKVIAHWSKTGGVLLMGYEMYRLLSTRKPKQAKRINKKAKNPIVIDIDEEDRNTELSLDIQAALLTPGPDLVVCDEGHRIKNSHAGISQALKSIKTRRRVVLTGYPLQNNMIEYWCMVDFVRPNFLGTKPEFCNMFERPIMNGQCMDSTPEDVKLMRHRAHVLHSLLEGFVQRRGHTVLQNSLPPKYEHVLMVRMSDIQQKLYRNYMAMCKDEAINGWSPVNPLRAFAVCCKIWNHPDILYNVIKKQNVGLDDDLDIGENESKPTRKRKRKKKGDSQRNSPAYMDSEDSMMPFPEKNNIINYDWAEETMEKYVPGVLENGMKMSILISLLEESMKLGDRILVFSQSLLTLTAIEDLLASRKMPGKDETWVKNKNYFRLDGSTSSMDREKQINLFNSDDNNDLHLFLLSTRAGCLGINLIGANRVIVFDASWNPCHDCQAVCRVFRYGQVKPCFIYRLVTENSLEKKIYERQVSKQSMSDRVVDELQPQNNFTRKQVDSLLEYEEQSFPEVDISSFEETTFDTVLVNAINMVKGCITKEPFTHESLLIHRKDYKLSKAEKRFARQNYEREKRMNVSYSRASYSNYYPPGMMSRYPGHPLIRPTIIGGGGRPYDIPRPSMTTPVPMRIQSQAEQAAIKNLVSAGVTVHQVVTTTDIVVPGTNTQTSAGPQVRIPAGQPILVIKTQKGVYIRTQEGRIFAVRSGKTLGDLGQSTVPMNLEEPTSTSSTEAMAGSSGLMRSIQTKPMRGGYGIPRPFGPGGEQYKKRIVIKHPSMINKDRQQLPEGSRMAALLSSGGSLITNKQPRINPIDIRHPPFNRRPVNKGEDDKNKKSDKNQGLDELDDQMDDDELDDEQMLGMTGRFQNRDQLPYGTDDYGFNPEDDFSDIDEDEEAIADELLAAGQARMHRGQSEGQKGMQSGSKAGKDMENFPDEEFMNQDDDEENPDLDDFGEEMEGMDDEESRSNPSSDLTNPEQGEQRRPSTEDKNKDNSESSKDKIAGQQQTKMSGDGTNKQMPSQNMNQKKTAPGQAPHQNKNLQGPRLNVTQAGRGALQGSKPVQQVIRVGAPQRQPSPSSRAPQQPQGRGMGQNPNRFPPPNVVGRGKPQGRGGAQVMRGRGGRGIQSTPQMMMSQQKGAPAARGRGQQQMRGFPKGRGGTMIEREKAMLHERAMIEREEAMYREQGMFDGEEDEEGLMGYDDEDFEDDELYDEYGNPLFGDDDFDDEGMPIPGGRFDPRMKQNNPNASKNPQQNPRMNAPDARPSASLGAHPTHRGENDENPEENEDFDDPEDYMDDEDFMDEDDEDLDFDDDDFDDNGVPIPGGKFDQYMQKMRMKQQNQNNPNASKLNQNNPNASKQNQNNPNASKQNQNNPNAPKNQQQKPQPQQQLTQQQKMQQGQQQNNQAMPNQPQRNPPQQQQMQQKNAQQAQQKQLQTQQISDKQQPNQQTPKTSMGSEIPNKPGALPITTNPGQPQTNDTPVSKDGSVTENTVTDAQGAMQKDSDKNTEPMKTGSAAPNVPTSVQQQQRPQTLNAGNIANMGSPRPQRPVAPQQGVNPRMPGQPRLNAPMSQRPPQPHGQMQHRQRTPSPMRQVAPGSQMMPRNMGPRAPGVQSRPQAPVRQRAPGPGNAQMRPQQGAMTRPQMQKGNMNTRNMTPQQLALHQQQQLVNFNPAGLPEGLFPEDGLFDDDELFPEDEMFSDEDYDEEDILAYQHGFMPERQDMYGMMPQQRLPANPPIPRTVRGAGPGGPRNMGPRAPHPGSMAQRVPQPGNMAQRAPRPSNMAPRNPGQMVRARPPSSVTIPPSRSPQTSMPSSVMSQASTVQKSASVGSGSAPSTPTSVTSQRSGSGSPSLQKVQNQGNPNNKGQNPNQGQNIQRQNSQTSQSSNQPGQGNPSQSQQGRAMPENRGPQMQQGKPLMQQHGNPNPLQDGNQVKQGKGSSQQTGQGNPNQKEQKQQPNAGQMNPRPQGQMPGMNPRQQAPGQAQGVNPRQLAPGLAQGMNPRQQVPGQTPGMNPRQPNPNQGMHQRPSYPGQMQGLNPRHPNPSHMQDVNQAQPNQGQMQGQVMNPRQPGSLQMPGMNPRQHGPGKSQGMNPGNPHEMQMPDFGPGDEDFDDQDFDDEDFLDALVKEEPNPLPHDQTGMFQGNMNLMNQQQYQQGSHGNHPGQLRPMQPRPNQQVQGQMNPQSKDQPRMPLQAGNLGDQNPGQHGNPVQKQQPRLNPMHGNNPSPMQSPKTPVNPLLPQNSPVQSPSSQAGNMSPQVQNMPISPLQQNRNFQHGNQAGQQQQMFQQQASPMRPQGMPQAVNPAQKMNYGHITPPHQNVNMNMSNFSSDESFGGMDFPSDSMASLDSLTSDFGQADMPAQHGNFVQQPFNPHGPPAPMRQPGNYGVGTGNQFGSLPPSPNMYPSQNMKRPINVGQMNMNQGQGQVNYPHVGPLQGGNIEIPPLDPPKKAKRPYRRRKPKDADVPGAEGATPGAEDGEKPKKTKRVYRKRAKPEQKDMPNPLGPNIPVPGMDIEFGGIPGPYGRTPAAPDYMGGYAMNSPGAPPYLMGDSTSPGMPPKPKKTPAKRGRKPKATPKAMPIGFDTNQQSPQFSDPNIMGSDNYMMNMMSNNVPDPFVEREPHSSRNVFRQSSQTAMPPFSRSENEAFANTGGVPQMTNPLYQNQNQGNYDQSESWMSSFNDSGQNYDSNVPSFEDSFWNSYEDTQQDRSQYPSASSLPQTGGTSAESQNTPSMQSLMNYQGGQEQGYSGNMYSGQNQVQQQSDGFDNSNLHGMYGVLDNSADMNNQYSSGYNPYDMGFGTDSTQSQSNQ